MTLRANKKLKANVSLSDPVGTDKEGNEITLIDLLHTDGDAIFDEVERNILTEKLLKVVKKVLDKREFEIIVLRYGLNGMGPLTQHEVAERFDISRSYVSRIEKKALEKIRIGAKNAGLYPD